MKSLGDLDQGPCFPHVHRSARKGGKQKFNSDKSKIIHLEKNCYLELEVMGFEHIVDNTLEREKKMHYKVLAKHCINPSNIIMCSSHLLSLTCSPQRNWKTQKASKNNPAYGTDPSSRIKDKHRCFNRGL